MARPFVTLIPNIAHRLDAWETIQSHLAKAPAPKLRPTVTISRTFGCEAFLLADRLKTELEAACGEPWNVYDKTLLEAVAQEEGIELRTLKNLGETARSLEKLGISPPEYYAHTEAFRAVAARLTQFATVGNAIIVGRGGAVLCKDMRNCFHFRLDASLEWRTKSIETRLELSHADALAFVKSNQGLREQFLREQLRVDPTDVSFFDAMFNNARHGVADIASAITGYVRSSWPDKDYFKA